MAAPPPPWDEQSRVNSGTQRQKDIRGRFWDGQGCEQRTQPEILSVVLLSYWIMNLSRVVKAGLGVGAVAGGFAMQTCRPEFDLLEAT